ncbi:hypothetical protein V3C99_006317 [Haemonchus contortus]
MRSNLGAVRHTADRDRLAYRARTARPITISTRDLCTGFMLDGADRHGADYRVSARRCRSMQLLSDARMQQEECAGSRHCRSRQEFGHHSGPESASGVSNSPDRLFSDYAGSLRQGTIRLLHAVRAFLFVPSDVWQAQAINRLLHHYNWTYIAVLYSAGNYGEKGFEALERLLSQKNSAVCVAYSQKIKSLAGEAEYRNVLKSLASQKSRPQVVVCFCEGLTVRNFFQAQKHLITRNKGFKRFQWIGSDSWADRNDVVTGLEDEAEGSFSIRIHAPKVPGFREYYSRLNPENNTMNPWFREFWQQKFGCQFAVSKEDKNNENIRICTGNEDLDKEYKEDPKLSQVINSISVVAFGLKAMYQDRCRDNSTLCTEMLSRNGTLLYQYLLNVTFEDQFKQSIYFDSNGDPPAWYDILNYVGKRSPDEPYAEVGSFQSNNINGVEELNMTDTRNIVFFDRSSDLPSSVCSKPCGIGQRQRETIACCWICENCMDHQIVNYTTNQCQNCSIGYWPDTTRSSCHALPHETISWSSFGSILALILATVGMITTTLTTVIFLRHNGTPVVKSTTRELSYIILSGIMTCYAVTFSILAKPSSVSCFLTRIIPPIAFSIVYSALLTKTNRIARILAGSKKRILTKKPRFLSTFSQVVITWILVGIQCVIVAVGVLQEWPSAGFSTHYLPSRLVLVCTTSSGSFLTPFMWNLLLISLCTLYAVKTRNLPENFNEAKFIGFTMYCTLVVWIAFVVLHMGTVNKALTMSFSFSLSASIPLLLLFFPKLYIIILHPEKNVRASYTTTKLIRCHFGNSQGTFDSKHLSSKTTRASLQSGSVRSSTKSSSLAGAGAGITRTASVHVPAAIKSGPGLIDSSTQTEATGKFARSFSIVGKKKPIDEDVAQLVEACRRYQDEKITATATNLLLEEQEDEVGSMLADSIGNSVRTVLSTVAGGVRPATTKPPPPKRHTLSPSFAEVSVKQSSSPSPPQPFVPKPPRVLSRDWKTPTIEEDGFEELLRSRGVQPLHFSQATPL